MRFVKRNRFGFALFFEAGHGSGSAFNEKKLDPDPDMVKLGSFRGSKYRAVEGSERSREWRL
jgi:hypothetical protein